MDEKIVARFWICVERGADAQCWNWCGPTGNGHPKIGKMYARRVSYELHHGGVTKGALVRPICGNRLCVNPAHLVLGPYSKSRRTDDVAVGSKITCCRCSVEKPALAEHFGRSHGRWRSTCRACEGRRIPWQERFWNSVARGADNQCWEWQATKVSKGYGWFGAPHETLAHRIAYGLRHGLIPNGGVICHACDNPACCNPGHLFLGTIHTNNLDMYVKGRGNQCLTTEQASAVRRALLAGERGVDVARRFGITRGLVSRIRTRRSYAWAK